MAIELPKKQLVADSFARAASTYDDVAILQRQTADALLKLLDKHVILPDCIVDLGTGTGRNLPLLAQRFPKASLVAIDIAQGMLHKAKQTFETHIKHQNDAYYVAGDAESLPLADCSVDLIYANLALQWCEPTLSFKEIQRVLKPNGLVVFTSLGPQTLHELRFAWSKVDNYTHVNAFHPIDDVKEAISINGFKASSITIERYVLTYSNAKSLMNDLKVLGARNVNRSRRPGLTGKHTLAKVEQAYEYFRQEGVLPATYQVIFGLAKSEKHQENTQ
jgi:malonyl-CoA O-methyltransferase